MSENEMTSSPTPCTWTLGVTIGEHAVGLAAVEYPVDDEGPKILAAVSDIHDAGTDPDGQIGDSRKARAGVARRTRRLHKRRRALLGSLANVLESFGCREPEAIPTHGAWKARATLVRYKINEDRRRNELVALAIMHMGRHRGWRSSWLGLDQLISLADQGPSSEFIKMKEAALERFAGAPTSKQGLKEKAERADTLGELVVTLVALNPYILVRPRNQPAREANLPLLCAQVRQEDVYRELRRIVEVQELGQEFLVRISEVLFRQEPPTISSSRIGNDPLDGTPRAPRASLASQEFDIRVAVAMLRDRTGHLLPSKTRKVLAQYLLDWRGDEPPLWPELEEQFGLALTVVSDSPPVDVTSIAIEHCTIGHISQWWALARHDMREALVLSIADAAGYGEGVDGVLEEFSDEELSALHSLRLATGHAIYSLNTLKAMNAIMCDTGCDLTTAQRKVARVDQQGHVVDANWRAPKDSFAIPTGQPALDRSLNIVGRFLRTASAKWGAPSQVVVALARAGTLDDIALAQRKNVQRRRKLFNERIRDDLMSKGIKNPSKRDVTKAILIERQGRCCLYCGMTITHDDSQIDHIVPRPTGGSNRLSNLAAICRRCKSAKGRQPFARWAMAESAPDGVSLQAAIARVRLWKRTRSVLDSDKTRKTIYNEFACYKSVVIHRLRRESDDDPLDERTIAATSYAAIALRERIEQYLESQPGHDPNHGRAQVLVYRDHITSLAQRHGSFAERVMLGDQRATTRLDRRYHALGAIVLSSLSASVAKTLAERDDLYQTSCLGDVPDLSREHYGSSPKDQVIFRAWLNTVDVLVDRVRDLLIRDQVPVIYPMRLRPQIGRVHDDTGKPLIRKELGASFSATEIRRITDRNVYTLLRGELKDQSELGPDDARSVRDENGTVLRGNDVVTLFSSRTGGMLRVGNSGHDLGTIHHGRVYAWRNSKGRIRFGMIRVFGGEFGRIGFRKQHVDLFQAELPTWSESWRLADHKVIDAITSGKAFYVGWLTPGDELDFGPVTHMPGNAARAFFDLYHETRWRVAGFDDSNRLRLRPLYLWGEGIGGEDVEVAHAVTSGKGWRPVINDVCCVPTLSVIRRTALGRPRWHSTVLPSSWCPSVEATKLLGD